MIFLVAGEPSGDVLGGRLMAALKAATGNTVTFQGVGGPAMQAQGLESLFPMSELSVMGIVEILPHARKLFGRMRETAAAIFMGGAHLHNFTDEDFVKADKAMEEKQKAMAAE